MVLFFCMKEGDDMEKLLNIAIDVLIIAAAFAVAEFFVEKVLKTDKWYWDLIIYMATYLLLSYTLDFMKKRFKKKEEETK